MRSTYYCKVIIIDVKNQNLAYLIFHSQLMRDKSYEIVKGVKVLLMSEFFSLNRVDNCDDQINLVQ